uniref:Cyclic nucleotide-binding domain-containing protein n=1 Tax=Biomphalaria glabrata TaxID=6526 RepID=A0A2C9L1K1_BIOGL
MRREREGGRQFGERETGAERVAKTDEEKKKVGQSLPLLQGWPTDLILGQTDNTKVTFGYFKRGSVLVKDSNFSDWLIIVKSGSLTVMKKLFKIKPDLSRRRLQAKSNRSANCDILLDAVSGDNWNSLPSVNQWERSRSTSSAPMSTQRASNVSNDPLIRSSSFRHAITSSRQRDLQYSQIQLKKNTKRHDVHEEAATKQSNEGDSTQGVLNTGEQITFLDFLDSAYDAK